MTPAALRSLFRHHLRLTRISLANPHRFRHTFGTTMARSGVSLPALMHLMGHSHIHTTMLYVRLSPEDVWREYHPRRFAIFVDLPLLCSYDQAAAPTHPADIRRSPA